jgi:hypothetical protein
MQIKPIIYLLKSHVDQHERRYASGASGTVRAYDDRRQRSNPDAPVHDYQIPPEVAKKMGATTIRLTQGKQIDDHRGFGLEHIRQQHGAEIKAAGYADEQAFVADVVANFNVIYALDGNRIALVSEHDGRQKIHVVEARKDASGSFYSVVTGYIADRMKFDPKRNRVLWRKLVKAFAALLLRRTGR